MVACPPGLIRPKVPGHVTADSATTVYYRNRRAVVSKIKQTMRKQITLLILLLTFNNLNAQTDEQIINEILFDLFGLQQDTILIKNLKTKTYFEYDSVSFENMTGLTVPLRIISEWNNNEENQDFSAERNVQNLNKIDTLFLENDTVIGKKPLFK